MRVVTMLPSATEIVYALGVEPVAVSHECDHPPGARERPSVDRTRVDPDADSAAIHEQVAAAERGEGVYAIDRETLRAADPDLVVTQGVCDVCAVDRVVVEDAVDALDLDCEVLTTDPHLLADVFADIERIGAALGRAEAAADLVADLRARVERVETAVEGRPRPRTAVLDWLDPLMVSGHWVPDLVERAGGAFGLAAPGERSTTREWADLRAYDPEVLVAAPCGFDPDRTRREADALTDRPGYADLAAVRDGRAYAVDGNHLVNRPGPRLVDTLEHLAGLIHPGAVDAPPTGPVRPFPAPAAERP
ncbi:MAG: ABC transporter substrate-binding protein [Haloferacaceae archaeon]